MTTYYGKATVLDDQAILQEAQMRERQRLEREILRAARNYANRRHLKWEWECIKACNDLDKAIDALLAFERENGGDDE